MLVGGGHMESGSGIQGHASSRRRSMEHRQMGSGATCHAAASALKLPLSSD